MKRKELEEQTSFLPYNASISQRSWHLANRIYEIPKCKVCLLNYVKWSSQKRYASCCSWTCRSKNPEYLKKISLAQKGKTRGARSDSATKNLKITMLAKYGVENAFQIPEVRRKIKQTNLKKYGVENPRQNEIIKEKCKRTLILKYGEDNPMKVPDIRNKALQTMKEKYGVEYALQDENIKIKAIVKLKSGAKLAKKKREASMLDKYGVSHNWSNPDTMDNIKQTNLKKYGVENYSQLKSPAASLIKLNNENYLIEQHHHNKKSMKGIGAELDVHGSTVSNYLDKLNIPKKYWNNSIGQKEIADFLRQHVEVAENVRNVIPPLELDVYIPTHGLAIEYCGLFWHCEINKEQKYHSNKLKMCKEKGVRLLTIFEDEWLNKKNLYKEKLLNILGLSIAPKIYARKCRIVDVSKKIKSDFYELNHIQGDGPGSIHCGLVYGNNLTACMSFINQKNDTYYLNRYATNCIVPGGFSRLLKHFINQHNPKKIITFADRKWSEGGLYHTCNFTLDKIILPGYRYIVRNKTYHKFGFRHSSLKNILSERYDPSLTEHKNCFNNGVYRIYDCGLLKFCMETL